MLEENNRTPVATSVAIGETKPSSDSTREIRQLGVCHHVLGHSFRSGPARELAPILFELDLIDVDGHHERISDHDSLVIAGEDAMCRAGTMIPAMFEYPSRRCAPGAPPAMSIS